MNEHKRDGLIFLGLMLASFATMFIAKNELVSTQNIFFDILFVLLIILSVFSIFLFGIFSLLESIKGWEN